MLQAPNPGPNPVDPNQLSSQPTAAASSQTLSIVFQCRWGHCRPSCSVHQASHLLPGCASSVASLLMGKGHRSLLCMWVLTRILLSSPTLPTWVRIFLEIKLILMNFQHD